MVDIKENFLSPQDGRVPTVRWILMDVPTLTALRGWSVRMCLPQGWVPCADLVLMVTMEMEQSVQVVFCLKRQTDKQMPETLTFTRSSE